MKIKCDTVRQQSLEAVERERERERATVYLTCKSSIWPHTSSLIEQNKGSNTFYNHIKKADYMQK